MSNKLVLIKKILETDKEIDKKIFALLESEEQVSGKKEKVYHIEDRQHLRKPVVMNADINTGNERIKARAHDVSLSGAFISTDKKIVKGENIAIRLISPDGEEFEFISEVVREEPSGIGILIKNISSFHQDRFHKFVKKL